MTVTVSGRFAYEAFPAQKLPFADAALAQLDEGMVNAMISEYTSYFPKEPSKGVLLASDEVQ